MKKLTYLYLLYIILVIILFFAVVMAEKMGESYEIDESVLTDDLNALKEEVQLEQMSTDPSEIVASLKPHARALQKEIGETPSSTEKNNDLRGALVVNHKENDTFSLTSWGVETTFKVISQDDGTKRLVLELDGVEYKKLSMEVSQLGDKDNINEDVKKFLNRANSANKEIRLSKDYQELLKIEDRLTRDANKSNYLEYFNNYKQIMAKNEFKRPTTSTARPTFASVFGSVNSYMQDKWKFVKNNKKDDIEALFIEKGLMQAPKPKKTRK